MRHAAARLREIDRAPPGAVRYLSLLEGRDPLSPIIGGSARVDFIPGYPLPVVECACNGMPLRFLIDNGANEVYLEKDVGDALGLRYYPGGLGTFAGGRRARFRLALVAQMAIGGISIANVPTLILEKIGQIGRVHIHGIVGSQVLSLFTTVFDYRRRRLELSLSRSDLTNGTGFSARIFGSHVFTLPATIAGSSRLVFVDCGGTFGFAPNELLWKELVSRRRIISKEGMSSAGHRVPYQSVTRVPIEFAGVRLACSVVGQVFPRSLDRLPVTLDAVVSDGVLSKLGRIALSFDPPRFSVL